MAQVMFKRGLSGSLPSTGIVDGAFYLTTDTNRLYVGQDNGKTGSEHAVQLVELNKSITIVDNLDGSVGTVLPRTGVADGQFYYVKNKNILCVYQNNNWIQINPDTDTKVSSLSITKNETDSNANQLVYNIVVGQTDGNNNVAGALTISKNDVAGITASVAVSLVSSAYNTSTKKITVNTNGAGASGTGISIEAGDYISLNDSTANNIKIVGRDSQYSLGSATNSTNISLTGAGSANGSNSSIELSGDTAITIDGSVKDKLTVKHNNVTRNDTNNSTPSSVGNEDIITYVSGVTSNAQGHITGITTDKAKIVDTTYTVGAPVLDNNGNLTIKIVNNNNPNVDISATAQNALYHKITVDGNESTVYNQTSLGNFYSASQIDTLLAGLNAMTYKGVVGGSESGAISTLPTSGVKVGDTYMVGADGTYGGQTNSKGDLLIATGTETNGVITSNLAWTRVKAGTDIDTTYSYIVDNNVIYAIPSTNINDRTNTVATISGGTALTATTSNKTITINHDTSGVTAGTYANNTQKTLSKADTFIVPKVTVDAQGHVTAAENISLTLPADADSTYTLSDSVTKQSDNRVSVVGTLAGGGTAAGYTGKIDFDLASSSLDLSVVAGNDTTPAKIAMDLNWGSF